LYDLSTCPPGNVVYTELRLESLRILRRSGNLLNVSWDSAAFPQKGERYKSVRRGHPRHLKCWETLWWPFHQLPQPHSWPWGLEVLPFGSYGRRTSVVCLRGWAPCCPGSLIGSARRLIVEPGTC